MSRQSVNGFDHKTLRHFNIPARLVQRQASMRTSAPALRNLKTVGL
jgi:hypothetical protein